MCELFFFSTEAIQVVVVAVDVYFFISGAESFYVYMNACVYARAVYFSVFTHKINDGCECRHMHDLIILFISFLSMDRFFGAARQRRWHFAYDRPQLSTA